MDKAEAQARIEEIGIVPGVRVSDPELATFAAEALYRSGIPVAEITMTIPGAIDVIARLRAEMPDMIVGAGTVLDSETAVRCIDAGAVFLTSPGVVLDVLECAKERGVLVLPGALTPTEVIAASRAGADFVKIYPCSQVGGHIYLRALKAPLPHIKLIASGGVNQQTALDFILSGATALGIGSELIPKEALRLRREEQIHELARRFQHMVKEGRSRSHPA